MTAAIVGMEIKKSDEPIATKKIAMTSGGVSYQTPVYDIATLASENLIKGPAIICDINSTTVVEPGWQAQFTTNGNLVLTRYQPRPKRESIGTCADPVMLEVFNNLFMSIAEQMGATLEKPLLQSISRKGWIFPVLFLTVTATWSPTHRIYRFILVAWVKASRP